MLLIDRYLLRELVSFFCIALGATTGVLLLDKLLGLMSLVLQHHLDLLTTLRLFCYILPTVSTLTLPMAFLFGCTLTLNRLSIDSEYIVFQAAGISLYRLMLPLLGAAIVVYGLSSVILMYVSPWGIRGLQRLFFEVAHTQAYYHLRPQEFNAAFKGLVLYVEHTDPEQQRLAGIFIADTRAGVSQIITAHAGTLFSQPETSQVVLRLHEGTIHRYVPEQTRYHLLQFGDYEIVLTLDNKFLRPVGSSASVREFFPGQFREAIEQRKAAGKDYRSLLLVWHKLFALPFACIIFAGLGPALGIVHTRAGRSSGYVLSIGAIFVYYILLTCSDALAEETQFPPLLAAWLPNLCMGGLTLWLLRRTAYGKL